MSYISNAFSLQMLKNPASIVVIEDISPEKVPVTAESCIGHADTAAVVSTILGRDIPVNRANISLGNGDYLYVAQLTGGRLPEGATSLPEGFSLTFKRVYVMDRSTLYSCESSPACLISAFWPKDEK